jgi:hypothetical protein
MSERTAARASRKRKVYSYFMHDGQKHDGTTGNLMAIDMLAVTSNLPLGTRPKVGEEADISSISALRS